MKLQITVAAKPIKKSCFCDVDVILDLNEKYLGGNVTLVRGNDGWNIFEVSPVFMRDLRYYFEDNAVLQAVLTLIENEAAIEAVMEE